MPAEIKKYNPRNFTPEHLFRPATSVIHSELVYLIGQLTKALEKEGRENGRQLLIGSELEIFFFNSDIDPIDAKEKYGVSERNPNYGKKHLEKMGKIRKFATRMTSKNPVDFMKADKFGRIFFEFRTTPQNSSDYLRTVEEFGELLRKKCKKLDILPVVHPQHIHVSLTKKARRSSQPSSRAWGILPDARVVKNAISTMNPLLLLPEEWKEHQSSDPVFLQNDGIRLKGNLDLEHSEFCRLSSEYAHDPILNLLVSLRAMYIGCIDTSLVSTGSYFDTYEAGVVAMENNSGLKHFLGASTLATLAKIAGQYPAVSRREKTIDQVR